MRSLRADQEKVRSYLILKKILKISKKFKINYPKTLQLRKCVNDITCNHQLHLCNNCQSCTHSSTSLECLRFSKCFAMSPLRA